MKGIKALFLAYVGYIVSQQAFMPSMSLFVAFLSVFLIATGGSLLNDFLDVNRDRINNPDRPLPSGKFSRNQILIIFISLLALGVILSFLINVNCFLIALSISAVLGFYEFKIKRKNFLIDSLFVGFFAAFSIVFGAMVSGNYRLASVLAIFTFLITVGIKITEIVGKKANSNGSESVTFSRGFISLLASLFLSFSVMLTSLMFLLQFLSTIYLFIVGIADLLLLYSAILLSYNPDKSSELLKFEKIGLVLILLAFLTIPL